MAARRSISPDHTQRRVRRVAAALCLLLTGVLLVAPERSRPALQAAEEEGKPPAPQAVVIPVTLPINGAVTQQVKRVIDQAIESIPAGENRPALILQFGAPGAKPAENADASELEPSYGLARYLIDPKLRGVRTIAYVPESLRGHAVLPVLACEQLVMAPHATIGEVLAASATADRGMQQDYDYIVDQRRTLPQPLVKAMLDKSLTVSKVSVGGQTKYVLGDELERLQKEGQVNEVWTVVSPDKPAVFRGDQLREYGFVSHLAKDRAELAAALQLPASAVEDDPSLQRGWHPVVVRLDGPIRNDKVNFIVRSLQQRLDAGDINLVCIEIDSAGGSLDDSMRLAQALADLHTRNVRTVAYVPRQARGDSALVAIACDHLVMHDNAQLGGPGEIELDLHDRESLVAPVRALVEPRSRHWSLPLAMVDRDVKVFRYVRISDQRPAFFCEEEWKEQEKPEDWQQGGEIATQNGLKGREAEEVGLAKFVVANFNELKAVYHLDNEPEHLHANWAHLLIENLARPQIAGILLFIAFLTLSIELMTPGIGVPGFISAVCFLLFFWANVLQGTAGTLEILLFVGGIACVAIEIFALPGFGAFGFGGVLMILSSVVLASQTFVIPRNAYQFEQLPRGIMMATIACAGVIVSLAIFRKYLHRAPVISRMLLQPPEGEELSRREALATFDHLLHKRGTAMTPLTPAGKARFGDDLVDVVSDGDFLPRGASVYVLETTGNRVVVKGIEEA